MAPLPRTEVRISRSGFSLKIRTPGPDFSGPWAGQGPNWVFGQKQKSDQGRTFPDLRSEVRIRKDEGPSWEGPDFHKVRIPADEVRILCVAFSVLRNPVLGAGNPVLGS